MFAKSHFSSSILNSKNRKKPIIVLFAIAFSIFSVTALIRSFAANPSIVLEAEDITTTVGNVSKVSDNSASNNEFLRFGSLQTATNNTPVGINGLLKVCGTQLCNQFNQPIQLRGMSTHGIQWFGWGSCINESSLDALKNDWQADIMRVSLYVQEGGYETNPSGFTTQAQTIIDELIERDMYALIDWHMLTPGDPNYNLERAKTYFTAMAERYKDKPNVLYEIANEPSGVSWSQIKNYAEEIIPVIRAIDPDSIIIVGTPGWSSLGISEGNGPSEIWNNPVAGSNLMYTFHFYAASHLGIYLDALDQMSDVLPVFVTEWGTQEYTGDGPNDFNSSQSYIDLMAAKKISWTSWNYSDDIRTGAVFKQGTCPNGPWSGSSLKEAGQWVMDKVINPADDFPVN